MKHDGYESDRNRICVYDLTTNKKTYVTEKFDSNVDDFVWAANSKNIYFIGPWHATVNIYQTNLKGDIKQLTEGKHNYVNISLLGNTGKKLLAIRQSHKQPNEIYSIAIAKKEKQSTQTQISFENKQVLDQLTMGNSQERWVKTTDGKDMLCLLYTSDAADDSTEV